LQKTIEELAKHGLIEVQTGSPYNSPILFAPKPKSTEMRFCFDSRELNKALLDHPYPAPTTEELFDRVVRLQHDARLALVRVPDALQVVDAVAPLVDEQRRRLVSPFPSPRLQPPRLPGRRWPWNRLRRSSLASFQQKRRSASSMWRKRVVAAAAAKKR
jgi:hypothetical protein